MTVQDLSALLEAHPEIPGARAMSEAGAANRARRNLAYLMTTDTTRGKYAGGYVYGLNGREWVETRPRATRPTDAATRAQEDALLDWAAWDPRLRVALGL